MFADCGSPDDVGGYIEVFDELSNDAELLEVFSAEDGIIG